MTTIRRRRAAPNRHVTHGGERHSISLTTLDLSRIAHAEHLARLFGVDANHSTIVRAGVALLVEHWDSVLKKLTGLDEDSDAAQRLVAREKFRIRCANGHGLTPWREYPKQEQERAVRALGEAFPSFASIIKAHQAKRLQMPLSELPVPGQDLLDLLNQSDSDERH